MRKHYIKKKLKNRKGWCDRSSKITNNNKILRIRFIK